MEERERSLTDEKNEVPLYDGNDTIRIHETTKGISHAKEDHPLPESATRSGSPTQEDDPLPVSSQPGLQPATYVVHVPKDLIYRVPPPEHALMLAERHAHHKKQKGSHCFSCQSCCSFFPFRRSRREESAPPTQKPDSDLC